MKTPKPKTILTILDTIDWRGHVELSEMDKGWLSTEIAAALSEGGAACGVCQELKPIVVQTPIGNICEDCIDDLSNDAEMVRHTMEGEE